MEDHSSLLPAIEALFCGDSSGHDYYHTLRVYKTAMQIAKDECCDRELVALGALLHDVDDEKLFSTHNYGNACKLMADAGVEPARAEAVINLIQSVSFRGTDSVVPDSIEGKIVQDADRLDALGAIGIARAFAYGGSRGRMLYDPAQPPKIGMDAEAYRQRQSSTVNHFYEKLFLLKSMMNTPTARDIAEKREAFMHAFLEEFYAEWSGER